MRYKTRYWNDKEEIEEGFVDTDELFKPLRIRRSGVAHGR